MIENTHRDLNIALINELAMIFNKMGINTEQVLQAAAYLQLQMSILPFPSGEIGPRVLFPLPLGEGWGEGSSPSTTSCTRPPWVASRAAWPTPSLPTPPTSRASSTCSSPPETPKSSAFVYAPSSSAHGDHPGLPKVEDIIGKPLSPNAVTKYVNELYADVFGKTYGLQNMGRRYSTSLARARTPTGPMPPSSRSGSPA